MTLAVRPAVREDVPAVHALLLELATFEKLEHLVTVTPDKLAEDAFGPAPKLRVRVAEHDGRLVGYAIYGFVYFSFTGQWGYLDDLYVTESARGTGAGKALLASVADDVLAAGAHGLQWFVLDWNEPAQRFYQAMGAELARDWWVEKVRGPEALRAFAARLRTSR